MVLIEHHQQCMSRWQLLANHKWAAEVVISCLTKEKWHNDSCWENRVTSINSPKYQRFCDQHSQCNEIPKPDANIEAVSFKFEDMWFIFPVFVWHKDSDHDDGEFDDELGEHGLVGHLVSIASGRYCSRRLFLHFPHIFVNQFYCLCSFYIVFAINGLQKASMSAKRKKISLLYFPQDRRKVVSGRLKLE